MKPERTSPDTTLDTIPPMPAWVTWTRAKTPEDVAFLSGAALSHLHLVLSRADVPQALLRERLALQAAEACVRFSGRSEQAGELRDAVHLLRAGDQPGPAGEIYLHWRRAVERPVSIESLHRAVSMHTQDQIAAWLNPYDGCDPCDGRGGRGPCDGGAAGQGGPIGRVCHVLETVLAAFPRQEATALILADAVLAQALRWTHAVPLLGGGLKSRDLRKTGEDLRLACHQAVVVSATETVRLAADLSRRAARLRMVAPKLRAKGAGAAVEMFLSQDAVAPSALPLSDRAARRFCDRLVELGVARELTGRDTFRLYGI